LDEFLDQFFLAFRLAHFSNLFFSRTDLTIDCFAPSDYSLVPMLTASLAHGKAAKLRSKSHPVQSISQAYAIDPPAAALPCLAKWIKPQKTDERTRINIITDRDAFQQFIVPFGNRFVLCTANAVLGFPADLGLML
jgi:hypothetical protein